MNNPSSALVRNLEYNLGLMDKQIKRVAELARFLPFADQQEEMNRLAKQLRNHARTSSQLWLDSVVPLGQSFMTLQSK